MDKSIAIIPLRKGSKGIPGKNKKRILGRPLYQWVLGAAIFSDLDRIYVATDDEEILEFIEKEYSWTNKVVGFRRSDESASDTASTELVMIELAEYLKYEFDSITLLQATSPFTSIADINKSLSKLSEDNCDSVLSVVPFKRFIWTRECIATNYDPLDRPRRQDYDEDFIENGAIYTSSKDAFKESKNRISGAIGLLYMSEFTAAEIDEDHDLIIANSLLESHLQSIKKNPCRINVMVFDVDGVLTDGKLSTSHGIELAKRFSLRDGMGFQLLRENGITPVIMTGSESNIIKDRMAKLGIKHTYYQVKDKYSRLSSFIQEQRDIYRNNIYRSDIAYIGDDINDLANIIGCGLSLCPNDADINIKTKADIILNANGGDHVVREAIEFVINYNKRF